MEKDYRAGDAQFVGKFSASEISSELFVEKLSGSAIHSEFCFSEDVQFIDLPVKESGIAVLLKKYAEEGDEHMVYRCLHKLRTTVRFVYLSTAEIIKQWFLSDFASKVGTEPCNSREVACQLSKYGGGGHLLGWLGEGKWNVSESNIQSDGSCSTCGTKLVFVDFPVVKFIDRLRQDIRSHVDLDSDMEEEDLQTFTDFEDFLGKNDKYTVIVDGANVARYCPSFEDENLLYEDEKLVISQIVDLFYMLDDDAKPLVIIKDKWYQIALKDPGNKALLDKWKAQNMLYIVPQGICCFWYMAYASVKLGCILVSNKNFHTSKYDLPWRHSEACHKWQEKYLITFHIDTIWINLFKPRPYSVDIQESEEGFWHVPMEGKAWEAEDATTWLCITRPRKKAAVVGKGVKCIEI